MTIKELDLIVEDIMTVDPKHHRYFVARRGEVLRQIGDQYGGVTVSFPRAGVQSDKVWNIFFVFKSFFIIYRTAASVCPKFQKTIFDLGRVQ